MINQNVSVVMCTYNGAKFLAPQLDSILAQTYPIEEIVIMDDCSTDDTVNILNAYCLNFPQIIVSVNKQNLGYTRNFQLGMQKAKCDIIAIADQDDIWHPNKIETMIGMWQGPEPMIYCNSVRFKDSPPLNPNDNPLYKRFQGTDCKKLCVFNTISGHAILLKKHLAQMAYTEKNNIFYDWWLGAVAACNGGVAYCPQILVYQRVHQNNESIGNGLEYKSGDLTKFKQMVENHLTEFSNIPNINTEQKLYFLTIAKLWSQAKFKRFSLPLAVFLFLNGKYVFAYKKKKFAYFSYLKHAIKLTLN